MMKRCGLWFVLVLLLHACAGGGDHAETPLEPEVSESIVEQAQAYYDNGDKEAAIDLWEKAAADGDAIAQHNLSIVYRMGDGVSKDEDKAAEWLTKSADQEYAPAMYDMGSAYLEQGNTAKALPLLQSAAANDYAPASFNLGLMMMRGDGVEKNEKDGMALIQKAAEQGFAPAQQALQQ